MTRTRGHTPPAQYEPRGYCPGCSYPMDAGTCPECGRQVASRELRSEPYKAGKAALIKVGRALLATLVILILLVLLGGFVWNWYYHKEFNTVVAAARAVPNIRVLHVCANHDLTIEEISLDLRVDEKHDVEWYLPEAPFNRSALFDSADELVLIQAGMMYYFPLGSRGALEEAVGVRLRGGRDVLQHYARILQVFESGAAKPDSTRSMQSGKAGDWQGRRIILKVGGRQSH